jgi:hypothetical protein
MKRVRFVFRPSAIRWTVGLAAFALGNAPMWALTGGHMASTIAINGAANEIAGPFAYGASLLMVTGSAVAWFRHHHDMGALGNGTMGALFVAGVALGGSSLLGFIPGVTGGLI